MSVAEVPPLPAAPLRERRWIPVLAVAAVLVGVVAGGYVLADALGESAGSTTSVSASVSVTPLPGWELAERFGDPPGARFTRGNASLDVASIPFAGTDEELLTSYIEEILQPDAEQLRVAETAETVTLAGGLSGVRIAYVGLFGDVQSPIEGEVTATVSPSGAGVVFDGWAPSGQLQYSIDDIHTMIQTSEIG
jgi:hypothetical protein